MPHNMVTNIDALPNVVSVGFFEVHEPWLHFERVLENVDSFLFVVSGVVYLSEEDNDYEIHQNELFCLKGGLRHFGKALIQPGTKWYWVSFTAPAEQTDTADSLVALPKQWRVTKSMEVLQYFRQMDEQFHAMEPYHSQRVNNCLHRLCLELLSETMHTACDGAQPIVQNIIAILQENVDKKFQVHTLAALCNLNYNYLCRVFKNATGTTILSYYTNLKVQRAIMLMMESDMNISQISNALQFPNPYYFSNVFKKETGYAPRDYLKLVYYNKV